MGVTLSEEGVTLRNDMLLTTATLPSQKAESSLLWYKLCPKGRIGRG